MDFNLRWERRKPTEEECRTRYYLAKLPTRAVYEVWCPDETGSDGWEDDVQICILPDILPAVDEPKIVAEWLWIRVSEEQEVISLKWVKHEYRPPIPGTGWFRTERKRERVVE